MVLDKPLGKANYYAWRIEFYKRVTPHVHSFIGIFDPQNIHSETA